MESEMRWDGEGILTGALACDARTKVSRGEHSCVEVDRQSDGGLITYHGVDEENAVKIIRSEISHYHRRGLKIWTEIKLG